MARSSGTTGSRTRLVDTGWGREIASASRDHGQELRIICPFIKVRALEPLLKYGPSTVQVITRFNLLDFAAGVSDIEALQMLLKAGARVRGVRNLHAKLYLFGQRLAIVTSANLTTAGLNRNHEFGLVSRDDDVIAACRTYFDNLWSHCRNDLTVHQLEHWDDTVQRFRSQGARLGQAPGLFDFGEDVGIEKEPEDALLIPIADARQAFVKLLGEGDNRVALSFQVTRELRRSGCHWAVAYPASKRPRQVRDGAVMFIGRMTKDPDDIRVFGRAIGMAHVPGRDDASAADIRHPGRKWKKKWSRYIRVHSAQFVAGTMDNGISLNEMMTVLGSKTFASTKRNASAGSGNTNPRTAYRQHAAVELSAEGLAWLSERLQKAFTLHGMVPEDTLTKLDWPKVPRVGS